MAVCPVLLSEESRGRLASALLLLHLTVALLAQALYLLALHVRQQLRQRAALLRDYEPDTVSRLLTTTAVLLAAFHLPSAKVCQDMGYKDTRRRWHACFLMWLAVDLGVSIATIVQMAALFRQRVLITDAFQLGFRQAITEYDDRPAVKSAVDRVQLEGGCCGSALYRDWFRVAWADPEQVNELSLFTGDRRMRDGLWLVPWAPWSCCNATHLGPCDSLWTLAPHRLTEQQQRQRHADIDKEMARLFPDSAPRRYRDADGALLSAHQVEQVLRQERARVRARRSAPAAGDGRAPTAGAAASNGTAAASNGTAAAGGDWAAVQPAPTLASMMAGLVGEAWFSADIPEEVAVPSALFVNTLNASDYRRRLRRLELRSYSPPQREAVRQRQLNQRGCAAFLSELTLELLAPAYGVLLLVVLCQVAVLAGARWLQTSCDLARRWGGDQLTAPGYLLFSWPCTLGEGQELQPPPEDPEAIFHMNDEEEDIMGSLGLEGVRDALNVAQGLASGDAREALGAVQDTGVLEGTRLEGAAQLLSAAAGDEDD
ncbi:uncharacterized protein LOC122365766 isoform X1 [Amphibalanus amphitrite]|uniref:uncharacterized protein LOC122365766 isoform X1 n=1 Tax=Amphibalanus amphitrite TaxID=1232801 RepID=UPI001C9286FA|nr:uncharacterized protein LOC122365766 isoform X1 [Amphibalanus amphitrite]